MRELSLEEVEAVVGGRAADSDFSNVISGVQGTEQEWKGGGGKSGGGGASGGW